MLNYEEPLLGDFLAESGHPCHVSYTEGIDWVNVNYAEDLEFARERFDG